MLLLTEEDFVQYATAAGGRPGQVLGSVAALDCWERFFGIGAKYPALAPAVAFSASGHWMIPSDAEACRKTLAISLRLHRELDPAKPEHMAIVGDLAALFLRAVAGLVSTVFSNYLPSVITQNRPLMIT